MKDLILVGSGHAHIQVIKKFAMQPLPDTRLTLISDRAFAPYSGMLPGYLAGWYSFNDIHFDLRQIAQKAGVVFIPDKVVGIDTASREIQLENRPPINYDLASINVGITPIINQSQKPPNLLPLKPISYFLEGWDLFLKNLKTSIKPLRIAVVGAGASGVEIALTIQKHVLELNSKSETHLYNSDTSILKGHNSKVQDFVARKLKSNGVIVHPNRNVKLFDGESLLFDNNYKEPADYVFLATQAAAPDWFAKSHLAVTDDGFLRVDSNLRVKSHEALFAAGDCISLDSYNLPKSGVYAVRQGPILAHNLRQHLLETHRYKKYYPQKKALALITMGEKSVVASRRKFFAHGRMLWRLKDYIDRKFMFRFQDMPKMEMAKPMKSEHENICGGCGSKVSPLILSQVMKRLPQTHDDSVLIGLKNPDDAAVILPKADYLRVETVDYFRTFTNDNYLLGQVAAAHCLGDVYAMGAQPHTAMATVTIPGSDKIAQDLFQLMSGALNIFKQENVTLVGGHTVETSDLGLGFSVSGYVKPDRLWKKSGAEPGDALIITKPLGTGMLLAGHMKGLTRGEWIEDMYKHVLQSHRFALEVLQKFHVKAATDITGFGLLGHLREMLSASNLSPQLNLENIPVMDGFFELYKQGIRSSLSNANRENILDIAMGIPDHVLEALIDPQTGGGLMIALPQSEALACVDALKSVGYAFCLQIGKVTGGVKNVKGRQQSAEL